MISFLHPSLSCVSSKPAGIGERQQSKQCSRLWRPDELPERHVVVPTQLILRGDRTGKMRWETRKLAKELGID